MKSKARTKALSRRAIHMFSRIKNSIFIDKETNTSYSAYLSFLNKNPSKTPNVYAPNILAVIIIFPYSAIS